MLATAALEDSHPPPGVVFVYVAVLPAQTVDGPAIGAAVVLTDTVNITEQPLREYVIIATPGATPVTRPKVDPTVATDGLLLVHMPPAGVLVSIDEPPTHKEGLPDIGEGPVVTVTTVVTWQPEASV